VRRWFEHITPTAPLYAWQASAFCPWALNTLPQPFSMPVA
jgi:hypothetical protein